MAIKSNLGCEINTSLIVKDSDMKLNNLMFSESHGRYIVTVKADALDDILSKIDVDCQCIGEVKGTSFKLDDIEIKLDDMVDAYTGVIEKYMK